VSTWTKYTSWTTRGRHTSWGRVVRSFVALVSGEGIARLFGLAATLILARRLAPTGFGLITLGITLVGWFGVVVDSGTETLNVRDISRAPERFREIADRVLGLRLALAIVTGAGYAIGVDLFANSDISRSVLLPFALVMPAVALNLRWMVLGLRQARAIAIGNVVARVTFLIGIATLVYGHRDLLRVPYLQALSELAYGLVIIAIVARGFGVTRPRIDLAAWKETLRGSLPLMIHGFARSALVTSDLLLIDLLIGPRQLGVYAAASKPPLFFSAAIGLFSVSFLAGYSATVTEEALELFRKAARILLGSSIAVAVVLSAAAPLIVPVVFGHRYDGAIASLAILSWILPLMAVTTPYANALIAGHRQLTLMKNTIIGGVFAVGAGVAGIELVGIKGAAVVRVASALLVLLLNYRSATIHVLAPRLGEIVFRFRPARARQLS
jgi:O-antigen/teichoic acid export membrane protein